MRAPAQTTASDQTFVISTYTVGDLKGISGSKGIQIQVYNAKFLSAAVVIPVTDTFLNTWRGNPNETKDSREITKTDASATVNYIGKSAKYARFYVVDASGMKQNSWDANLLEVTYNGSDADQAGSQNTNGVYVSDAAGINFSNLAVTLKAGANNMANYRVVTVLSNDALTGTQEPQWDEEYTYSFTYPMVVVSETLDISSLENTSLEFNVHNDVLSRFGKSADCSDMYQSWYGGWYVLDATGARQPIAFGGSQGNEVWNVQMRNDNGNWSGDVYNGCSISNSCASISSATGNAQWQCQQMLGFLKVFAPSRNDNLNNFAGYQIVYECTDEYTSGTAVPKLKYIFTIPSAIIFEYDGTPASVPVRQTLDSRDATSVTLDWASIITTGVKYARFFVVDNNGDPVDATEAAHHLTVSDGTQCINPTSGYYVYPGNDANIDFSNLQVTLSSTGSLVGYKVKCWLATSETNILLDGTTVIEEPDITNEYVYSFEKPLVTKTNVINKTIDWSKFAMHANASTSDIATDWNTTWDDLSVVQYVKWYVVDASNNVLPLEIGAERQADKWTISPGASFVVDGNKAVLTGQSSFTESQWNDVWGKPFIYVPAGKNFDDVKNCKVICEVSERADASVTPNVRYVFTIEKAYLGELKDGGSTDSEVMVVENGTTSVTVPLGNATTKYTGTAKYARVWLTNAAGEAVDPAGMLTVTGASTFDGHPEYGFYWSAEDGVSLSNATLALSQGSFPNYQVHVALSADAFSATSTNEPDYDFVYTFGFQYDFKTKYRTIMYTQNGTTITVNPQLLTNWHELSGDCDVSGRGWADNGYVHWYLINAHTGDRIQINANNNNTSNRYTSLGGVNGYERSGFDQIYNNNDPRTVIPAGTDYYNPSFNFTLPQGLSTEDVRLVCDAGIMQPGLVYSDFEDGSDGGWTAQGNGTSDVDNSQGYQSNSSLHLVNLTAGESWSSQCKYEQPLRPNGEYIIRFGAKSNVENGSLQFIYQNDNPFNHQGPNWNDYAVGTDWNQYTIQFTVPAAHDDVKRILFNFGSLAAEYWIDNIEFEAVQPQNGLPELRVKYVFDLMTETDLQNLNNQTFVHYQGETHRPYQIVDGTPGATEFSWDYTDGSIDRTTYATQNIRQSVHQVDYYIYLDKQPGETAELALPLEGWSDRDNDNPSSTEPLGFYRWYDWNTDCMTDCLVGPGSMLYPTDYGYICNWISNRMARNNGQWPWRPEEKFRNLIGVDFKVPDDFDSMDEVVIACDVSRYMDGLDDSKRNLVHEPTLSIRYLFHVRPAKSIANEIDEKSRILRALEDGSKTVANLSENELRDLFKLYEDNGRVVVSLLKGTTGKFALRVNLKELGHYFINNDQNLVQGSQLRWYAYYQDENGDLWKFPINMEVEVPMTGTVPEGQPEGEPHYYTNNKHRYQLRLAKYEMTDFLGTYTKLGGSETKILETLPSGTNLHVVGCVGNGTVEKPVSCYDLVFLDAGPKPLGTATTQVEQTYAMEMNVGAVLTFDDLFSEDDSIRLAKPTSSAENYALMPQKWPLGQYGYCYPSLYGQDASSWAIYHSWWNGYGIGPTHGDYMLLKSMNMPNVSYTAGSSGDQNGTFDTQSYYAWWYSEGEPKLFDVTHERLYGKDFETDGDDAKYGTYMYIDASDEARTYASLEFDASLCAGAEIYYTAYIANMAPNVGRIENTEDRKAPPQVMFRVTTDVDVYNADSTAVIGTKRIPVVSFLTGDIESMDANQLGVWYMVSGHTQIPAELEYLLDGTPRTFHVSIDNFAENTKGADYCVDEITFYTTSAKVRAYVTSERCTTDRGTTMRVHAEAESLIKALGDGIGQKNIFYRIYKKHDNMELPIQEGEDFTGHDVYTDGSGQANDQYGTVLMDMSYDLSTVPAYDPAHPDALVGGITPGSGYYRDADGVVQFQFVERSFELEPGQGYFVSFYNFGYDRVSEPREWGNPYVGSVCTVYSNFFYSNKVFLKPMEAGTEQEASGVIDFACGETEVEVTYNLKLQYPEDDGTVVAYTNVHFDYFVGKVNWDDEDPSDDDLDAQEVSKARFELVKAAVTALRAFNQNPLTYDELDDLNISGYSNAETGQQFDNDMRTLLLGYMLGPDEQHPHRYPRLLLDASTSFHYKFKAPNGNYFQAIPVDTETSGGEDICAPLEMMFFVDDTSGGPKIALGFDDVDYPDTYKKQVVRVGLEQLAKMRDEDDTKRYKLHIPIKTFDNKGHGKERRIYFPKDGAKLTLVAVDKNAEEKVPATTDPVLLAQQNPVGTMFAEIVSPTGDNAPPYVDKSHMYLTLDLKGCAIDFHEGYEYEVSTSFYDESEEEVDDEDKCFGDLYLVIKVVPEFITWDAHQIGNTGFYSANWYNDENWKRSVRADLYKDENVDGKKQNTQTPGHPNGYDNDGEGSLAALTGELYNANPNPGYVPMKFTYVTLLSGNHAPSLINEVRVRSDQNNKSKADQGGSLIDPSNLTGTQMLTDTSPYTHLYSSYPTDNIRYDMMVRYGDHAHGGEGCFGHRYMGENGWSSHSSSSGHNHGLPDENAHVFDVEKFYGNTCKEIYFKPGAELLRQQRLYYQKAWVETELVANKWSLVSTPLKKTFAGDMYVPTKMNDLSMKTPAEKPGRQMTEAFQPISFSTTPVEAQPTGENAHSSAPAYSRTKYPIYQRSWNTDGSKVYTKTNDARANDYSANLGYTTFNGNFVEWSHTYNDVQVPYTSLSGFSIRADRKQHVMTEGSNQVDVPALIRLPKADETYDYYDWSDTGSTPAGGVQRVRNNETDVVGKTYYYGDTGPHNENTNYRFIIDGPSGNGEYTVPVSQVQKQGDYLLLGNPCMASIDMAKFFAENTDLTPGYWTFTNGEASTQLTEGIIRPLQGFFVKNNGATEITFSRGMTIDGNFPGEQASGGSRLYAVKLHATNEQGGSSAELRLSNEADGDYREGEDVETLFDSNLSDVPMVYTVAGGQAVSIDQRPQLDLVSFGVVQAKNEPVEVKVTSHLSNQTSSLYFIDALTGEQTLMTDSITVTIQPNDYGRYFLSTTSVQSMTAKEQGIIISVRQQEVTVTANGGQLNMVRATTLNGVAAYSSDAGLGSQCRFKLPKGVYIIQARTNDGFQRQLKVVVE